MTCLQAALSWWAVAALRLIDEGHLSISCCLATLHVVQTDWPFDLGVECHHVYNEQRGEL